MLSRECHDLVYIRQSIFIFKIVSFLFSWQSLGREISAQLQRISQLRMEPRMLSEQFNKPVDGTTNFDSPSGITVTVTTKYYTVFFLCNECPKTNLKLSLRPVTWDSGR